MKTVFVLKDGTVAIPSSEYPGPTAPGTLLSYDGRTFVVVEGAQPIRYFTETIGITEFRKWEKAVTVDPIEPAPAPAEVARKPKDKSNKQGRALVKEG
jgi:hypothetical protein